MDGALGKGFIRFQFLKEFYILSYKVCSRNKNSNIKIGIHKNKLVSI